MGDIKTLIGSSLVAMLTAVVMGKTLKTLVVDLLAKLASKTKNKEDDKLVEDVREDLGLPPEPVVTSPNGDEEKK